MKDSELENCDDKKKELNYDAQVVDDLDYYVWDWVEKKPRLHEEIKSIPKLRKFILPQIAGKIFKPRKKNFRFPTKI
jgi:hypothetical protein